MDTKECLNILREIKDVAMATVGTDGKPKNRIIDVMLVEDEKLYFTTARFKNFYKELLADSNVAITAMTKDYNMVRLDGKAEKMEDNRLWVDKILEVNPAVSELYPGERRYLLEVFCISKGELQFFFLGENEMKKSKFKLGE